MAPHSVGLGLSSVARFLGEVAELLKVLVSWVYERTRKRGLERIPGFPLGKYWRFRMEDVLGGWSGNEGEDAPMLDVETTIEADAERGGRVSRKERMTRPRYQDGLFMDSW